MSGGGQTQQSKLTPQQLAMLQGIAGSASPQMMKAMQSMSMMNLGSQSQPGMQQMPGGPPLGMQGGLMGPSGQ